MHSALTPFGAIFESNDGSNRNRIIEFHNTELLDHGEGRSLIAAGAYAIWSAGFAGRQLFLRDLALKNTIEIAVDGLEIGNTDNDLEPDGTVFFWTLDDYDIYSYRNGIVTKLIDDDSQKIWNVAPLGAGELVIYQKSTPCCNNQSFAIALNNGANEIILREFNQFRTSSEYDYQIMNNWIGHRWRF